MCRVGALGKRQSNFGLTPPDLAFKLAFEVCATSTRMLAEADYARNGDEMGVLAYIALTVAVFALLGLTQKLVERL
ncbi:MULTISPECIES: hypothetical protein [Mycobacterium]|uniref:Uncharacterized protein n=1 Tax=Mycobacterium kiyosense TaxID=2871094 RepID=A0A9P3Q9W9_9MYCO|nr:MULTISPECIES: hypothetical protein [Mycobacterium]BDE16160.1 hypothetical protein MKCMC460_50200 [Mycobacterium sp. 20KCMC460]GLB82169.1 hypothetical protein SRL2020028_14250 [Mycobacterium kiyosense]GLB90540.1 hypothetical protein SRL2020130_33570 [Mycobacterium kiyosense]GLB95311.1 hypothetical protein SRL2020226_20870 [Mycobacterium kiyosense]GLC03653.1 hypothetical protein SRL2020400_42440 [Mycobacterium kiyosense]